MYGTEYERRDLEVIMKYFPEAEITNPAKIKFKHKWLMPLYENLASLHDVIIYRPIVGRFITSGVYEEIKAGLWKGVKIMRISKKNNETVLEEINTVKDYPLSLKESNLLGKVLSLIDEQYLIEEVSSLRARHRLTPKSALILVCAKIIAKKLRKDWGQTLREIMDNPKEISKHWLNVIKKEEARKRIETLIANTRNELSKLIISTALIFNDSDELKIKLVRKFATLPERILAYNYALILRQMKWSYKKIAKELREVYNIRVSPGQVCNWIKGRYNPLRRCGRINDCPELGYVIAAWLGDGSLAIDNKEFKHIVKLNSKDIEFVQEWGKSLAKVTGIPNPYKPKWDKYNKRWEISVSNIILWMILTIAKENPWLVYSILEKYPESACRGWFDAEGGVNISGKKIMGTNTDIQQIILFQRLLQKLSINSKYRSRSDEGTEFVSPYSGKLCRRKRTNYDLVIQSKIDHLKFAQMVGFTIPRKQTRLMELLRKEGFKV